jgi:hypothetical protein
LDSSALTRVLQWARRWTDAEISNLPFILTVMIDMFLHFGTLPEDDKLYDHQVPALELVRMMLLSLDLIGPPENRADRARGHGGRHGAGHAPAEASVPASRPPPRL